MVRCSGHSCCTVHGMNWGGRSASPAGQAPTHEQDEVWVPEPRKSCNFCQHALGGDVIVHEQQLDCYDCALHHDQTCLDLTTSCRSQTRRLNMFAQLQAMCSQADSQADTSRRHGGWMCTIVTGLCLSKKALHASCPHLHLADEDFCIASNSNPFAHNDCAGVKDPRLQMRVGIIGKTQSPAQRDCSDATLLTLHWGRIRC